MAELAKAYVQIVPSAKGISGSISEALGGEATSAGTKSGNDFGKSLVSALKTAIAAAGIGKLLSEVITEGSSLEQSIGGVKTLFGANEMSIQEYAASVGQSVEEVKGKYSALQAAENTVLANANNAWQTAGLSANDYMEQATSFAAALVSSLGGDTQAAADAADRAIVDMADNANKMGTSMEDIQNAYGGFAKQNYTMLDNLKLGYGGTKTEMERLLADAQAISGVEYDISNLSDVYSAIHVIQEDLGITGTTAKEAATTWTGSFAAMKASAQNVMANLFTGADMSQSLSALVESTTTFVTGNLIPAFANIATALPSALSTLGSALVTALNAAIPQVMAAAPGVISGLIDGMTAGLPQLTSGAISIIETLTQGIQENFPSLIQSGLQSLVTFSGSLRENAGSLIDAGLALISSLVDGLIASLPTMIETIPTIVTNIAGIINDNAPKLLTTGLTLIGKLAMGLIQAIPTLIANIPQILEAIVSVFTAFNWISLGGNIVTALGNGLTAMGGMLSSAGQNLLEAIKGALMNLPSTLANLATSAATAFKGGFSSLASAAGSLALNVLSSIASGLAGLPGKLLSLATTAISSFKTAFTGIDWGSIGTNIINGIIGGIGGAVSGLVDAAVSAASSAFDAVKSALGIASPSKEFAWIGNMMIAGWEKGWGRNVGGMLSTVKSDTESMLDMAAGDLGTATLGIDGTLRANRVAMAAAEPVTGTRYSFGNIVFNSPEAISAASATREMQDFMKRSKWDLP